MNRNKDELDVPDATSLAPSDITELDLRKEIKYGNRIQVIKRKETNLRTKLPLYGFISYGKFYIYIHHITISFIITAAHCYFPALPLRRAYWLWSVQNVYISWDMRPSKSFFMNTKLFLFVGVISLNCEIVLTLSGSQFYSTLTRRTTFLLWMNVVAGHFIDFHLNAYVYRIVNEKHTLYFSQKLFIEEYLTGVHFILGAFCIGNM